MIEFKNLSFRYEESKTNVLNGINLTVKDGEFLLLTGRSGCGKTTLIRSLNGLIPHFYPGKISGELLLDGASLMEKKPKELAGVVGTVFQDPRSQFFMTDTTRELAFGCENMGMTREETIRRVAKTAQELEIQELLNRSIFALSSGERQQIAIGSVYALSPKIYIFDEPSANLDYDATKRLADVLKKLKREGCTVLIVEHRFYFLRELIDRVCWIEGGRIAKTFTREEFCNMDEQYRVEHGIRTPFPEREALHYKNENGSQNQKQHNSTGTLEVKNLEFHYQKDRVILNNISFQAQAGDIIGILGHNGAGKTTLLSILSGLLKEKKGEILYNGKKVSYKKRKDISYLVMQDTDYQLFASSVEDELALGIKRDCSLLVENTLHALELDDYKERHPASLSGGQKQRVTIGAGKVKESAIIYFDEPTSGLDYDSMVRVSKIIKELSESGAIIFVVSHDFEFIVRSCTKILQLDSNQKAEYTDMSRELLKDLTKKYFNESIEEASYVSESI